MTSDSIKWSNNLTNNTLKPGTTLIIPPINGVAYTVKSGDSADSLGKKYNVPAEQIIPEMKATEGWPAIVELIDLLARLVCGHDVHVRL